MRSTRASPRTFDISATDPAPDVVSYTIDEEHGWVTASSVSGGLLIGYFWKTSDYPWFNAWRR